MTDDGRVPGRRLRAFAERTFDPQTLETIILPALADLQHECSRAANGAFFVVALRLLRSRRHGLQF